jgi:hypothetical protein
MSNENIINLVIKQTNYTRDETIEKLKVWDGNYINVVKEYLNPNFQDKKVEKKLSKNQQIMKGIRNFMDEASKNYEKRKLQQKKINDDKKKLQRDKMFLEQVEKESKISENKFKKQEEEEKKIRLDLYKQKKQEVLEKQIIENNLDGLKIEEVIKS